MVCSIYDWNVVVIISLITLVTSSQSMIHSITQVVDGDGMMKRLHPEHQVTNYIDVKSVDEYSLKIQKIEGKVVIPKWQYQKWDIWRFALTLRITLLVFEETDESAK
jgi:hypothetical protein